MKKIVVISDPHCGHEFGLTPPSWWTRDDTEDQRVNKVGKFQRELWKFYTKAIDLEKPIDILMSLGDMIDGKGDRSGSIEQITTDRLEQIRMASQVIDYAEAKKVRIQYGTRYHVGKDEDYESLLHEMTKCEDVKVGGHGFYNIDGVVFDVKHKINSSAIPHGRHTALARARLWNAIWNSEHERQPKANVFLRGHVHYFVFNGGSNWLGMTCPALTYNSAFGIRECEGIVDVGIIVFEIDKGEYSWKRVMAEFANLKVKAESL